MAVLKHIVSKNANYGESLDYLLFQHDERTKKPILNEHGQMILREEYYLDGLNCEPMLFDKECERLNDQYHKNQTYDEIKSHHYIKSVYAQFRKSKNKQKFRHEHSAELALYEKAVTSLKEKNGTQPLPTMKQLREQKEKLLTQKDTLQKQYDYYRDYQKELHTVCRNVDMILGWNPPIQTTHTKEFQL